jgi:hypothetical protein
MAESENEDFLEQAVLNLPMPQSGPPNPSPKFLEKFNAAREYNKI